jgi:hypothetical protein
MRILTILWLLTSSLAYGQQISGQELLQKTLQYHDPNGEWALLNATVRYDEYRANNTIRKSVARFNNTNNRFKLERTNDKLVITRGTVADSCYVLVNGSAEFDLALDSVFNLACERSFMYRNYYLYMQGLPMKLLDEGTVVHEDVALTEFMGKSYFKVKVTYDEPVGSDIWYMYINPQTYAVEVYQFYHDESINDGEYILLEGSVKVGNMVWPESRSWYTNKDQKYLGKDVIVEVRTH